MKVDWMSDGMRRYLKTVPLARKAITIARGEHKPFHKKLDFSNTELLPHKLYIGTHHKTGTVWMGRTFSTFAKISDSSLQHIQTKQHLERSRNHIILDYRASHNHVDFSTCRGFRMVRDPRDLLISATLFHRRADEPWLHERSEDGTTYQERISALSEEDAILFEMDNWSGRVIREMLDFDGGETIQTVHYEDYLRDPDMELWHPLLRSIGLGGLDLILAQQALFERSLFGQAGRATNHISKRKKGWQPYFTPKVEARFEELFGAAHTKLGYQD